MNKKIFMWILPVLMMAGAASALDCTESAYGSRTCYDVNDPFSYSVTSGNVRILEYKAYNHSQAAQPIERAMIFYNPTWGEPTLSDNAKIISYTSYYETHPVAVEVEAIAPRIDFPAVVFGEGVSVKCTGSTIGMSPSEISDKSALGSIC